MQTSTCLPLAALLLLASSAQAQWSADPAVNLSVADAASDQILAKLAPTADGGCWISWYDGIASGFDVRVQKLDAQGEELLPHAGVLVLDRGFSSVQDYGLDVDSAGNALLAFRDDTGPGVQITAAQVTPAGTLPWGAAGVQLTSTTAFVASPKICGLSDGAAVVAWTQGSDTRVRRISSAGTLQWVSDKVLSPGVGSYSASDLHGQGTDALLSFVHQSGGFGSPRHLFAQKFNVAGDLQWGAAHVAVFDGGSLQFGNFPSFDVDGSGGGVFAWYDTASPQLQVHVQHVLASGAEAFPHNGTVGSTNATRDRVGPSAAYDPVSGDTFLFWEEQSLGQTGLYGQKVDAGGVRQWGADGIAYVPLGATSLTQVRALPPAPAQSSALVAWNDAPAFGADTLHAMRVGAGGLVELAPFDLSSLASGKSRLAAARSATGDALFCWTDDRVDAGDVLAQNINCAGELGGPGTVYCTAGTTANGCNALIRAAGVPSASLGSGFTVTVGDLDGQKQGLIFYGINGPVANPWGAGSSYLCVKGPTQRTPVQNSGGTLGTCDGSLSIDWNAFIAGKPTALGNPYAGGETVWIQGWFRDPPSPKSTSLSNALSFTVCP